MDEVKIAVKPNTTLSPGKLCIGTAGYDYPSWAGQFYQTGLARSEYLGAYSESFACLELCFSRDHCASKEDVMSMLSKLRRPMDFSIRLGGRLTTAAAPSGWKSELLTLAKSIAYFAEKDCLFSLVACFPASFRYGKEERLYLDSLLKNLGAFPMTVEFINKEWLNARLIEGLKTRGVCLCTSDLPRVEGFPPPSELLTTDFSYIRFHGRSIEAWINGQGGSSAYRYSRDELLPWLGRLENIALEAKAIRAVFCDKKGAAAPLSAGTMTKLARSAGLLKA